MYAIVSIKILTIRLTQAVTVHIHTQGRFNNDTAHSVYRIMVTATSVMGMMKMGNIVPRARIEPHISGILGQCADHYTT